MGRNEVGRATGSPERMRDDSEVSHQQRSGLANTMAIGELEFDFLSSYAYLLQKF
jgi:hypothetical protein